MKIRVIALLAAVLLTGGRLAALRPGEDASELKNVKWFIGGMSTAPENAKDAAARPRIAVFMLMRANSANDTITRLKALNAAYPTLRIAIITPDPEADAAAQATKIRSAKLSYGADIERQATRNYMAGSLFYPGAFLISADGKIIWRGEAVDLHEALKSYFAGELDLGNQKKLAPIIEELQTLIRDSNEIKMRKLTDKALAIDPGNAAVLRLRVFMLENTGRAPEAWQLIASQITEKPQLARLYFTLLDLASRYPGLTPKLDGELKKFTAKVTDFDARNLMAWSLLNALPGNTAALETAVELCREAAPEKRNSEQLASRAATLALLAYRLGDVKTALTEQQKATEYWRAARSAGGIADSTARENYFKTVLKLGSAGK